MVRDEAACFDEGKRRAADATTAASMFGVGPFLRGCLEYSQPTAGFCDNVPPPTSIGRTAAWQQERCGEDGICRNLLSVVQTYCTEGRPKREPGDTLLMNGEGAAGGSPGVEVVGENAPPATAGEDSAAGSF